MVGYLALTQITFTIEDVHFNFLNRIQQLYCSKQDSSIIMETKLDRKLTMLSSLSPNHGLNQESKIQIANRSSVPNGVLITNAFQSQYAASQAGSPTSNRRPSVGPGQQIVYIEGRSFIAARNDRINCEPPRKVIELKRSTSKGSRNRSNSIRTLNQATNEPILVTPGRECLKQKHQNSLHYKQNSGCQERERMIVKIDILERRISELHQEKQTMEMKWLHHNTMLTRQLEAKEERIKYLQDKLNIVTCQLQNKCHELMQIQKRLEGLQEKQVYIEKDQHKSITTQNFINLALTEQIEKIKYCNHQLEIQLMNCRSQHRKYDNHFSEQTKQISPLHQDMEFTGTSDQENREQQAEIENLMEYSRQIMEVDSEHMNIDEIIHRIHQMTLQNQELKGKAETVSLQLQECKNEIFVKDAIAIETARIMNEIKEVAMNAHEDSHQMRKIRDILTQIY